MPQRASYQGVYDTTEGRNKEAGQMSNTNRRGKKSSLYGLQLKCPSKAHVLEAQSPG